MLGCKQEESRAHAPDKELLRLTITDEATLNAIDSPNPANANIPSVALLEEERYLKEGKLQVGGKISITRDNQSDA